MLDVIKVGSSDGLDDKMQRPAAHRADGPRKRRAPDGRRCRGGHRRGASDADIQLAVLIASGFSMYNRLVDGFRARTPPAEEAYRERAAEIAEHGYSAPPPVEAS